MTPAAASGANATRFDFRRSPRETLAIDREASPLPPSHIDDSVRRAAPLSGRGRPIAGIATHIENVRLTRLPAGDRTTKLPSNLDHEQAKRAEVRAALTASPEAVPGQPENGLDDRAGKVPHFKPDRVAFSGYLMAHDSHCREQIAKLARQVASARTGFGLPEWGTLWRERGK